jgi:uncharacterized protein (TIGR00269 family)
MKKCQNCEKFNGAVRLEYMKRILCKKCFSELFVKRIRRTIRKNNLLDKKDRKVAVALSGGKSSSTLLKILHELSKKAPRSKLIAISIDEGRDDEYRKKSLKISEEFCNELGVEHYVYLLKKKRKKMKYEFLNEKALSLKVDKIAFGCSLEDEIQAAIMNFIRGNFDKTIEKRKKWDGKGKKIIPRIKPLRECPENEILTYANMNEVKFYSLDSDESKKEDSFRREIEKMIEKIEKEHPGTKFQLLRSMDDLIQILKEEKGKKLKDRI